MSNQPIPSPWLRDVKWGEWLFYIGSSGLIAYVGARFVPGATNDSAVAAGVAAGVAAALSFIRNPKDLPWKEKEGE